MIKYIFNYKGYFQIVFLMDDLFLVMNDIQLSELFRIFLFNEIL